MSLLGIIGGVAKTVSSIVIGDQEIRKIKTGGKHEIEKLKIELKKAEVQARIESKKMQAQNDMSYDMQVLKNRRETFIDEVIISAFISVIILTFLPITQDSMTNGWSALNETPWWFQFGIVGILVSTLGLKDVLRMWVVKIPAISKKNTEKKNEG